MEGDGSGFELANPNLLEKIDKLFACTAGEYMDLPQLIVVGDQSSGKRSVLEALPSLPFPRARVVSVHYLQRRSSIGGPKGHTYRFR